MSVKSIKKFAFILGRERDLCLAELKAVLSYFCFDFPASSASRTANAGWDIISVSNNVVFINIVGADEDFPTRMIDRLAGTTKIFTLLDRRESNLAPQVASIVMSKRDNNKINFGISSYSNDLNENAVNMLGLKSKKVISSQCPVRFVALHGDKELSTIVSTKQIVGKKGVELGIFNEEIGVLSAVNNPEPWGERDYGKPAGDRYSGMLPPKLARIMINLALEKVSSIKDQISVNNQVFKNSIIGNCNLITDNCDNIVIADPFCGSGNVLMEALMLGYNAFGSDYSTKAVKNSQENLNWLSAHNIHHVIPAPCLPAGRKAGTQGPCIDSGSRATGRNDSLFESKYCVTKADAAKDNFNKLLSTLYSQLSTVAIVTEPFLGEPKKFKPTMNAVRGEYRKVKDLYLEFFKNFITLRTFQCPLVFCVVFPLVETLDGGRYSLYRDSVDEIRKIGYTELQSPLIYGRDYQVVKREIVLLAQK